MYTNVGAVEKITSVQSLFTQMAPDGFQGSRVRDERDVFGPQSMKALVPKSNITNKG